MAFELIEIKDFEKTALLAGSGNEYIVVSKADGKTYAMKTSDFKMFLGTVTSITPRPIKPTDPSPTQDGVYIPTVDGTYANADGLKRETGEGQADYGMAVEFIKNGAVWVKNTYPLPIQDISGFVEKEPSAIPFSIKNKTSPNLVLRATLNDGSEWPSMPDSALEKEQIYNISSPNITLERRTQYYDTSRDGIWNQWIEPQAAIDNEGNTWIASVGNHGDLYITKRTQDGTAYRKRIGNILAASGQSDDHNSPAILLDNRNGATYPIMVFQCDHNTRPMRYWRFDSKDMSTWDSVSPSNIGAENVAYTQVWRNDDEIFVLSRIPTGVRPWRIAYSSDNGGSWETRTIFSTPASWLYCLGRLKTDGSGVNIAMHGHPLNSANQNIYFLELDFASGAIVNPANRAVPVIADIRAAISNPSFVPIDPFVVGLTLYTATGTQITRLWDVSRDVTGDCAVVFNIFSSSVGSMENFNESKYAVTSFKLSSGTINHTTEIEESGMPVENPAGNNFYTAGASMVSNSKALVMTWRNESMIAGGDDTTGNIGKTLCQIVDFTNPSSLIKKEIITSDLKVIRPYTLGDEFLCNECEYFNDFNNFFSTVLINSIK